MSVFLQQGSSSTSASKLLRCLIQKLKESPTRCTSCGRTRGLREVSTDRYKIDVTSLARAEGRPRSYLSLTRSLA